MRATASGCRRTWEGHTNRLLTAGVGNTFMKAFGTAFTTGAGLASCHTRQGHRPVGGGVFLLGPAAPPTSGAACDAHAAAGWGQGGAAAVLLGVGGCGAGAVFTSTSCTVSESLSESSSDEEDSSEEAAAPPAAEKNRDIRLRLSGARRSRLATWKAA